MDSLIENVINSVLIEKLQIMCDYMLLNTFYVCVCVCYLCIAVNYIVH